MNKTFLPLAFLLGIVLYSNSLFGQKSTIDSLRKNITLQTARDSFRVKAISQYLKAGINNHLHDFLPMVNELIQLSKEIKYKAGTAKGYELALIYFNDAGDYPKSLLYADSAFTILQNDTSLRAKRSKGFLFNNRGTSFTKIGDFQKALSDYTASAKIFERLDDPFLATIYSNISEVYGEMHIEEKCTEYENLSVQSAEKSKDDDILCLALLNQTTGLLKRIELQKAEAILKKTLPLVSKLENSMYYQVQLYNTGMLAELRSNYADAISNYKSSLLLTRQNGDPYQECTILNKLSECFNKTGDNKTSKRYLDTLLDRSSIYGIKFFKNEVYKKLASWYRRYGDYKMADEFMQRYTLLNDSMASEKTIHDIARIEGKYKLEQKDAEIDQLKKVSMLQTLSLKQKKWLNYFLAGSAAILSLVILLIFLNYKQKQKLQQQQISELILEKKLSTTEAILKGEEKERTRIAKDLHDGLSGMLSGVKYSLQNMQGNLIMTPDNQQLFGRSMDMLDNSIKEMRRVAQNMMPEALVQFGLDVALKDFAAEINRTGMIKTIYESMGLEEEKMDQSKAITIYRIIQELVNNVIKHANAQQVFIQLLLEANKLIVNVDDNGSGFDKTMLQSSPGMGWKNILTRVEYLKGKIDVKTEPGKGTAVNIELNLTA